MQKNYLNKFKSHRLQWSLRWYWRTWRVRWPTPFFERKSYTWWRWLSWGWCRLMWWLWCYWWSLRERFRKILSLGLFVRKTNPFFILRPFLDILFRLLGRSVGFGVIGHRKSLNFLPRFGRTRIKQWKWMQDNDYLPVQQGIPRADLPVQLGVQQELCKGVEPLKAHRSVSCNHALYICEHVWLE